MSAKIESQPIEKTFEKQPKMDKVHRDKSSTSATDKEETTKKSGTSIWAARDPWSKPETAKDPWDKPGAKTSKTKKVSNSSAKNEKDKIWLYEGRIKETLSLSGRSDISGKTLHSCTT